MRRDLLFRPTPRRAAVPLGWLVIAGMAVHILLGCFPVFADTPRGRWQLFSPIATVSAETTPHPAVARVVVDEGRLQANGTGSLIAVRDQQGLVVTNWHVVRGAKGAIQVIFPDGFTSPATVLKTDEDWDLAALLIWKPSTPPLAIAAAAPQPGEPLKIAGYGSGDYRAAQGKCTQYVAPSIKHPYEIVELSAEARQGDSGGPILNAQGELAGVLFGSSRGSTSGSYCGRVRWFLSAVWPEVGAPQATYGAGNLGPGNLGPGGGDTPLVAYDPPTSPSSAPAPPRMEADSASATPLVPIPLPSNALPQPSANEHPESGTGYESGGVDTTWSSLPPLQNSTPSPKLKWEELIGTSRWDVAKSVLALCGVLAIWGHLARWMSS